MKQFVNLKKRAFYTFLCLVGLNSAAHASDVTIPNTFASGETVSSSSMNQNFTAIESAVNDNDQRIVALENQGASKVNVINGDNSLLGVSIGASDFESFGILTNTNYKVPVRWDMDIGGYRIESGGEQNGVYFINTTCTDQAYTNFISPKSLNTFDGFGVGYTGSSLIPITAESQLQFDSTCALLGTPINMDALTVNINDPTETAFDPSTLVFPVMLSR